MEWHITFHPGSITTVSSNSNNVAIKLMGDHTDASVTNNTISKTGLIIGMGRSGDETYLGIRLMGITVLLSIIQ